MIKKRNITPAVTLCLTMLALTLDVCLAVSSSLLLVASKQEKGGQAQSVCLCVRAL